MIQALRRLAPYILRARRPVILGLACVLVATAVSLISPWVLKYAIDDLTQGLSRTRLAVYGAMILGLALADGYFRYLTRKLLIGASRQIEYDLRNDFFGHLTGLPLGYYQSHRTGELMSRATNDLSAVRMMIGPAVMYSAGTALTVVIAVGVMCMIDVRLTLLALLPLPFVTVATRYFGRAIHDRFERIQAQLADMSAVVQEALAGVRVVRAYRQEDAELARFRRSNDEYVARNRGLIQLQGMFYPTLALLFGLSVAAVIWIGGREVIDKRLTLGEFVAFNRYLVLLIWPMIAFGWVINLVQRGVASWERMLEVMDVPRQDAGEVAAEAAPAVTRGAIEIRDLTYPYPGASADALVDVSFSVQPGETVAIVGATGSGKSTLASLVPRLHEPPRGAVFVDGTDVRDLPIARLRAGISVVAQEAFLFSDTLSSNIAFGLDREEREAEIEREAVVRAAELARLDADVTAFPGGYDTVIGERGITLSGGQKQRAAIARAILADRPILILDDAVSAVDTATEEALLHGLRQVRHTRTCLIIAHRISTVRDADAILVLERGRIIERGTHATLVERNGVYASMHRRQLLEEELGQEQ